jgi:hypothetical protein
LPVASVHSRAFDVAMQLCRVKASRHVRTWRHVDVPAPPAIDAIAWLHLTRDVINFVRGSRRLLRGNAAEISERSAPTGNISMTRSARSTAC